VKFLGALLLLIVIAVMVGGRSTKPPEAPFSPEEKAKKEAGDQRWASQVSLVRALRSSMKNPDSFKIEEAVELDDGTICITYRATNSSNAVIPGQAVLSLKGQSVTSDDRRFGARWNATCAKKSGRDIMHIRTAL